MRLTYLSAVSGTRHCPIGPAQAGLERTLLSAQHPHLAHQYCPAASHRLSIAFHFIHVKAAVAHVCPYHRFLVCLLLKAESFAPAEAPVGTRLAPVSPLFSCTVTSHTMAAAAIDSLDEFFDFARLEHDHIHHTVANSCQQQHDPFLLPEDNTVSAMDWATTHESMATCPASVFLPNDVYMQDAFEPSSANHNTQQWPLIDAPGPSFSSSSSSTTTGAGVHNMKSSTLSPWHPDSLVATQNSATSRALYSTIPSPSSLSLRQHEVDLIETFNVLDESAAAQLGESTPGNDSAPASDASATRTRPTAPRRQASVTSWKPASAKRKGPQSRIPFEARQILEDEFTANPYPCSWEMDIIAHQANLDVKKVRNWFNNTRARKKCEGK